ncbi:unnamed protein product [Phytophthora lilii]|uniref:Unnamed protein product n=1 Tax=Phytophthora lilii TaxID=2077276 RepID=A0A9W6TBP4_9STRA|nr:unnamed protein product [Phytophthora lilii]
MDVLFAYLVEESTKSLCKQVQGLIDKVDENRSGELEYSEFVRNPIADLTGNIHSSHLFSAARHESTTPTLFRYAVTVEDLSAVNETHLPLCRQLLNGSMSLHGLLRRWDPEWRMRRLLEEVENLLITPDEALIAEFEAETAQMLHRSGVDTQTATAAIIAASKSQAARHPRVITLECIALYRTNRDVFIREAQRLTQHCAQPNFN